ncbi:unnamed protein product [Linum trigynum]|uniref:Uncharacterized protein n=1 Tax=Linum trigynum TaxID=586398 RepID=A0AAV2EWS5_9ROSI
MLPATASRIRTPFVVAVAGLHDDHHHVEKENYSGGRPRSGGFSSLGHLSKSQLITSSSSVKRSLLSSRVVVRSAGVDPVAGTDAVVALPAAGISLPFDLLHDSQWQLWLLGAVASFVIPLVTGKLGPLGKLFDKFDAAVDTAQGVADMVDDVAEKVEEVVDDIGNSLPAGALKDALEYVENLADQTEKVAEYTADLLDKVEEVGDKVEEFAESTIANKPTSTTTEVVPEEVKAEM